MTTGDSYSMRSSRDSDQFSKPGNGIMTWRYIGWFAMGFATHAIIMAVVRQDWSLAATYLCTLAGSALVSFGIIGKRGMT
jgi:hypothetical protein